MRLTEVGGEVGSDTTAELPGGVLPGDLLVAAVTNGDLGATGWLNLDLAGVDNAYTKVADGTETSMAVTYNSSGGLSFLLNGWQVSAFRGFRAYEDFAAPTAADLDYTLPAVPPVPPGEHRAAVMVVSSRNGTVAGHPEQDLGGFWVLSRFNQRGRRASTIYWWNSSVLPDRELVPAASIRVTGTAPKWQAVAFSVDLIPDDTRLVTRQWPRDSLGLAAAPRIYPPPRTNRLVGGHL